MRMHYGTLMIYDKSRKRKTEQRWWKTACKRKTLTANQWAQPTDITVYPHKVTCEKCLQEIGLELLSEL